MWIFYTAADCGSLPAPINGNLTAVPATTFESIAVYTCNSGFNIIGQATRTCQADGIWSGSEPMCALAGKFSSFYPLNLFYHTHVDSTSSSIAIGPIVGGGVGAIVAVSASAVVIVMILVYYCLKTKNQQ